MGNSHSGGGKEKSNKSAQRTTQCREPVYDERMFADLKRSRELTMQFLTRTMTAMRDGQFPEKYVNLQKDYMFYRETMMEFISQSYNVEKAIENLLRAEGKLPVKP
eukprot:m51a1_g1492 hypothetical protein (106) ;mRNA; r:322302-322619